MNIQLCTVKSARSCISGILLLLFSAGFALGTERIELFLSRIDIKVNRSVSVYELIAVEAKGEKIKRGIYRDISLPFDLTKNDFAYDLLSIDYVKRNGKPIEYSVENHEGVARIIMGSKDILINPGNYEYEISYSLGEQIEFNESVSNLVWSVTGSWPFQIVRAETIISIPHGNKMIEIKPFIDKNPQNSELVSIEKIKGGQELRLVSTIPITDAKEFRFVASMSGDAIEKPPHLSSNGVNEQGMVYNIADYFNSREALDAVTSLAKGVELVFKAGKPRFLAGKITMGNQHLPTTPRFERRSTRADLSDLWAMVQGRAPIQQIKFVYCSFDVSDKGLERGFSVVNAKLVQQDDNTLFFECRTIR